jgi:acyl-CoA synthetase (AMP-forming)/AMP-acid ligase II
LPVNDIYSSDLYPVLSTTLWESFEATVRKEPDATCVIDGERRMSRSEVADAVVRLSAGFAEAGVTKRDRIVMKGDNRAETVIGSVAASRVGAVLVPVPGTYGPRETSYIAGKVDARLLVWSTDRGALEGDLPVGSAGTSVVKFDDVAGCGSTAPVPDLLGVDEVCVVGFTAGTTGEPKGVMHSTASVNYSSARWAEVVGLQADDRVLGLLPMSYLTGYVFNIHMPLSRAMAVVCLPKWDPIAALRLMERERCAWATAITTHIIMMVEAAKAHTPFDLSSVRALTCGGSPIADDLVDKVSEHLGVKLLRAYGLSECLGAAMMGPDDPIEARRRYDGGAVLNTDIEAFDEDGNMLPRGSTGLGGMRGPELFLGYYGEPEQSASSFGASGFLMTGDLIVRTEDGYVKVVGRAKDIIIRGGMNIDPVEVENLLRTCDDVQDVAVVGYPDDRLGEKACALVVVNEGCSFSFDRMVAFLEGEGLSKHKLPERYVEIDEIPLSPLGKPLKAELRQRILDNGV